MDLKLTGPNGNGYDLDLTNGDVTFVKGREAIGQHVLMVLRTFLGESVYDTSAGVPYIQVIFQRGVAVATIEQVLSQVILNVPGVISIESFTINLLSPGSRTLTASAIITTEDGEIDFTDENIL